MAIEHKDIQDPNLHEPKGASTATSKTLYVANGTGSGSWEKLPIQSLSGVVGDGLAGQSVTADGAGNFVIAWASAFGNVYYTNIAAPTVITYPSAYTKVNVATSAGGGTVEFAEGVNARLTYIGADTREVMVEAAVCLAQSDAAAKDIRLSIYKNGALHANSESIMTVGVGVKQQLHTSVNTTAVTNDYFEVFVKNDGAAGNVSIYTLKLTAKGLLS